MRQTPKHNEPTFILFADIAGYTALMQEKEQSAAVLLQKFRTNIKSFIAQYEGEIINFYGDGALCLFSNVDQMLQAAIYVQRQFKEAPVVPVRIGLHSGIVHFEDNNAFGNAINIASRIESIGVAGSITLSKVIYDLIEKDDRYNLVSLGGFTFKHIKEKMDVFALSNKGMIVPKRREIQGKLEEKTSNPIYIILGTVLVMLFLLMGHNYFAQPHKGDRWDQSLAIIPFENLNQDERQDYFSDGITQDILTNLSSIKELQVISFNSSKRYKNSEKKVQEIGEELGVKHLLLGSVQHSGEKLRVRTMLINSENDEQLWAKSYDSPIKDVFDIQSEVAKDIADVLKTKLTPAIAKRLHKRSTNNLDAYQFYSQARYEWELRTPSSLHKALDYFQKAIDLDSTFALAYAGIAQTYITLGSNRFMLTNIAFPKGKEYAEKTLELNPEIAEAYTSLAAYYYDHDFQFDQSLHYFNKALALNPNDATTHQWLAEAYHAKGDAVNARKEIEIAKQLNPQSIAVQVVDANIHLGENQTNKAIDLLQKVFKKYPTARMVQDNLLFALLKKGEQQQAFDLLYSFDAQKNRPYLWIELYARFNDFDKLRSLQSIVEQEPNAAYKTWLAKQIDFHLLLEKGDLKNYIAMIDTFYFIEKSRNLFSHQNFHPPSSVIHHSDYQELMRQRNFQLVPR